MVSSLVVVDSSIPSGTASPEASGVLPAGFASRHESFGPMRRQKLWPMQLHCCVALTLIATPILEPQPKSGHSNGYHPNDSHEYPKHHRQMRWRVMVLKHRILNTRRHRSGKYLSYKRCGECYLCRSSQYDALSIWKGSADMSAIVNVLETSSESAAIAPTAAFERAEHLFSTANSEHQAERTRLITALLGSPEVRL